MLKEVDAKTLHRWIEDDEAVLIDVREAEEYAKEHIIGARLVPLSGFDKADFAADRNKIAVFHCRSGNRTQMAAPQLLQSGFADVYHLDGGIEGWKKAGYPVHFDARQPISIMVVSPRFAGNGRDGRRIAPAAAPAYSQPQQ